MVLWVVEELSHISCWTILIFFITLLLVWIIKQIRLNRLYPPGPSGVPLLGMLPRIKKEFHLFLFDLCKTYGGILSLRMGSQLIVVLSDPNTIKKAFAKAEFAGRPQTEFSSILGGYGIINSEGQLWRNQRRFLHQQKFGMKHWGSGSTQMESRITDEVLYLLTSIEAEKTNPFNPAPILNCAISNVVCSIIMSTRFHHNDKKFQRFMYLFDEGFRLFTLTGAMAFIPIMKHLPGIQNTVNEIKKCRDEMLEFVNFIVEEHKTKLDSKNPRDLVDSYLLAMEKAKEDGNLDQVFNSMNPEKQLQQILLDIFTAGVETLKTTMQWAMLHMIHNPEIRKKVHAELDSVVGSHRLPCQADMADLPYTRATIYEVMRRSTVIPMGTTHATDRTVELEGHLIPKNTHVIPLLHAVHMDPEVWDQPEEFRPERFLNNEGKVHKPKQFMPFGSGQRMCLGDSLAEMELQLFFSSIMHVFDLEAPSSELPSLQGVTGVTVSPRDFEVNFIARNVEALIATNTKSKQESAWTQHVRVYG
jgi:26-hydroxylase